MIHTLSLTPSRELSTRTGEQHRFRCRPMTYTGIASAMPSLPASLTNIV